LRRFGARIQIPPDFSGAPEQDVDALRNAAAADRRVERARDAAGPSGRVIQALTGGPLLVERLPQRPAAI